MLEVVFKNLEEEDFILKKNYTIVKVRFIIFKLNREYPKPMGNGQIYMEMLCSLTLTMYLKI